ncbi:ComF family protein [Salipiger aestuarii]|uniref:ComF family protein n=1 Tax=Salipiger aestuarii TaxID=568098 RepID=UPI00025B7E83|nr:ComF family protein [Salipiger aestuarii]EIE50099.1 competence protein F [Citreicella sp. 357]KAA8616201.1 competence protein ComF [Salipiger aestuarii]
MFMPALQTVLKMVYPSRCLICGGLVETDFGLCGTCWRDTPFIAGLTCDCCGIPLIGDSDDAEFCDDCLVTPPPWMQGRAGLVYRDNGRKLVLMLKHGDRHDIALPAASWMARQARPMLRDNMIAVPVPLHLRRHFKRRYNQSALLSRALAQELGIDHVPDALERLRHTASLDGKSREARYHALADALRVRPRCRHLIEGRPVLIVDDVLTSGATLSAATEACLAAGASEVCISVLARVAKEP